MAGTKNDVLVGKNADFSQVNAPNSTSSENNGLIANGQLWIGSTSVNAGGTHIKVGTITPGTGIAVTNGSGTITISSTGPTTDLHVAKLIVNPSGTAAGGNFTTITSALASAVSGDTIFITPGTYTENLTLKAGVNLTAFEGDGIISSMGTSVAANVIILGTVTASFTGTATISGIQLRTNAAAAFVTSGSNVGSTIFNNCSLFANNATGMTINNVNHGVTFYSCQFTSSSTNLLFAVTTGTLFFQSCFISLSGTASASTLAASTIRFTSCDIINLAITTSTTGSVNINSSSWVSSGSTLLTMVGTGVSSIYNSTLASTTASTISADTGTTVNIYNTSVSSSNTNALTGGGTINAGPITYNGSSFINNATTKTYAAFGETGTFTPTLIGASTAGTTTYNGQQGYYVRVGNLVTVYGFVSLTAATGTGIVQLGGLPFTIKNQTSYSVPGSVFWNAGASWVWPAGTTSICTLGVTNTTTANLWVSGTASGGGFVSMANAAVQMSYTFTYQI
jgi:hypothetical protein